MQDQAAPLHAPASLLFRQSPPHQFVDKFLGRALFRRPDLYHRPGLRGRAVCLRRAQMARALSGQYPVGINRPAAQPT